MAGLTAAELLRNIATFSVLSEEQRRIVAELGEYVTLRAGAPMLKAGENWSVLHVILSGQVRLVDDRGPGTPLTLDVVSEGGCVGESSLFSEGPSELSAYAITEVTLFRLRKEILDGLLERRPEIGLMKAMGAGEAHVARLFLLEATVTGLLGGVLGYFSGSLLAGVLAEKIFGTPVSVEWIIFPAMLTVALAINLAGHAWPLLWARRFSPTEILHDPQAV